MQRQRSSGRDEGLREDACPTGASFAHPRDTPKIIAGRVRRSPRHQTILERPCPLRVAIQHPSVAPASAPGRSAPPAPRRMEPQPEQPHSSHRTSLTVTTAIPARAGVGPNQTIAVGPHGVVILTWTAARNRGRLPARPVPTSLAHIREEWPDPRGVRRQAQHPGHRLKPAGHQRRLRGPRRRAQRSRRPQALPDPSPSNPTPRSHSPAPITGHQPGRSAWSPGLRLTASRPGSSRPRARPRAASSRPAA